MKYPKFTCEICKRKSTGIRCIIFHITGEIMGIPHSYPVGIHYLGCIECNMCYMSQFYNQTNKEVEDWAKFIFKIEKDKI